MEDDAIPFTLASPDGQNPRMDRVVLRHDKEARSIDVFLLQGTPSATPAAPELTRGDMVYELSLATITVGASVGAIAQEDITDTRNVPNVCGLSRVHSSVNGGV
ncbi:hypothetical protein AGMMS49992_25980 [Clostridia bacterium]|nr:hypothetical protein AGMMS49992_25980 [Clostridia bacterium]